jgi:hypothetical protein
VDATSALATITPPPGGCTPVSYVISHARARTLDAPARTPVPAVGGRTARLGNLAVGVEYEATAVGVCADGTRTPPSPPALFTPVGSCKPTLLGVGGDECGIYGNTSYSCPAAPRAVLVLKCVAGSAGACGAAAAAESPAAAPPGGVLVTTDNAQLSPDKDYTCYSAARNADGSAAICSDPVVITISFCQCFPADATVQVRGRGAVRMDALRVGDAVLSVGYSGALEFQDVYFFGRRQHGAPAEPGAPQDVFSWYHAIQAVASLSSAFLDLRVSSSHFVPVTLDAAGWCNASAAGGVVAPPAWASHTMLVAKDVKPGMVMWHVAPGSDAIGGAPSPACVTANLRTLEYGAFVPYVQARAIVVNSVAASPHTRWKSFALNW